jgi:hypothetical protein
VQAVMAPVAILYCLPLRPRLLIIVLLALLVSPNLGVHLVHVSMLASPELLTAVFVTSVVVCVFLSNILSSLFGRFEDNFDTWPWMPSDISTGERSSGKRTKKMEVRAAPCPFTGKHRFYPSLLSYTSLTLH